MSKGKPIGPCNTCGSEVVDSVNEGVFRDGECEACEYERYRSQPALLEACDGLLLALENGDHGDPTNAVQVQQGQQVSWVANWALTP